MEEENREHEELLQSIAEFFGGEVITLDENPFEVEEEGYYECSPVEASEIKEVVFAADSSEAKKKMLNLHPKYFRHGYVCRRKIDEKPDIDIWYLRRVLSNETLEDEKDFQIKKEGTEYRLSYKGKGVCRFDRKWKALEFQELLSRSGLFQVPIPEWKSGIEFWKFWSLYRFVEVGAVEDARKSLVKSSQMIEFKQGNLLEENAEALVNTVNCAGVMGKGIALQFKQAFPENFRYYEKACRADEVQLGHMTIFRTGSLSYPRYIINFPTKCHWKDKSRIEDIVSGLKALVVEVQRLNISSIAIPALGCGNGGLDWANVKPLIESAFAELPDVKVIVFEP
jgi:O-acetyl-ADP-ribose deacetylase (regulator of RNase III)